MYDSYAILLDTLFGLKDIFGHFPWHCEHTIILFAWFVSKYTSKIIQTLRLN